MTCAVENEDAGLNYLQKAQADLDLLVGKESEQLSMSILGNPSAAPALRQIVEDAMRYRALMSGRVSHFGSAGLSPNGKDPNGNPNDGYAYYVMEAWTIKPVGLPEASIAQDTRAREAMSNYTAIAAVRNLLPSSFRSREEELRDAIHKTCTRGLYEQLVDVPGQRICQRPESRYVLVAQVGDVQRKWPVVMRQLLPNAYEQESIRVLSPESARDVLNYALSLVLPYGTEFSLEDVFSRLSLEMSKVAALLNSQSDTALHQFDVLQKEGALDDAMGDIVVKAHIGDDPR